MTLQDAIVMEEKIADFSEDIQIAQLHEQIANWLKELQLYKELGGWKLP